MASADKLRLHDPLQEQCVLPPSAARRFVQPRRQHPLRQCRHDTHEHEEPSPGKPKSKRCHDYLEEICRIHPHTNSPTSRACGARAAAAILHRGEAGPHLQTAEGRKEKPHSRSRRAASAPHSPDPQLHAGDGEKRKSMPPLRSNAGQAYLERSRQIRTSPTSTIDALEDKEPDHLERCLYAPKICFESACRHSPRRKQTPYSYYTEERGGRLSLPISGRRGRRRREEEAPGNSRWLSRTGGGEKKERRRGTRDEPLPLCLELLLGEDRDQWPLEAKFIEAAYDGNVRDIKKIAKDLDVQGQGISVTVANTTYLGLNALHAAGGRGKLPAYQYLVEEVKMEIDKRDTTQGYTPLEHAVTFGHLPAIRYLLDHGADLHQKRSQVNVTLLHSAAVNGHSEVVRFLLSRGADVDALSVLGTPLALAALKGYASTVKILLQHNADPNKCTPLFGPLDMALLKSSVSCVKLLIQGGANVSGVSPCDNPLVKATEKGLTEAIKCLLEAGANPNVLDMDDNFVRTRMSDLKRQADEAFKKQDYLNASEFYTQALKMDNFDAKLLSNRSLCWLRMGNGERASHDAEQCTELHPKWAKAHYRLGAALMFTKDYNNAYDSLARALELDPESEEAEKLFWEAMELRS